MKKIAQVFLVSFVFAISSCGRDLTHRADSAKDEEFLQEIPEIVTADNGLSGNEVREILVDQRGAIWFGTDKGVCSFDGRNWQHVYDSPVTAMAFTGGELWVGGQNQLKSFDGNQWKNYSLSQDQGKITALAPSSRGVLIGTTTYSAIFEQMSGVFYPLNVGVGKSITALKEDGLGRIWVGTISDGLYLFDNGSLRQFTTVDGLLSDSIRDVVLDENNKVLVATDKGLNSFDGQRWSAMADLPYKDLTKIFISPEGQLLVGSHFGAMRYDGSKWHYYESHRYVPTDYVSAVAYGSDKTLYFGSNGGLGIVRRVSTRLAEKADHFEEITQSRHNRLGMIGSCRLEKAGNPQSFILEDSDNDGLWTQMYVAAEAFRYAATGDSRAKDFAKKSLETMFFLEKITGAPGYPARSVVPIGEKYYHDPDAWKVSSDGKWYWKGDTSCDEIIGHFFGYSAYYDLIADQNERRRIKEVISKMASRIVDNNFQLIDENGKVTSWGRWNPAQVDSFVIGGKGFHYDLAIQILAILKTAFYITGDDKFQKAYLYLVDEHDYARKAARWHEASVGGHDFIGFSRDNLAFLSYYLLMRYENDPSLRGIYKNGLALAWQMDEETKSPFFNFIYGQEAQTSYGLREAVETLRDYPWSLVDWKMNNSQRADVQIQDWQGDQAYGVHPLPVDEVRPRNANMDPYELDGGNDSDEEAGTWWLISYWLGRYQGFIK